MDLWWSPRLFCSGLKYTTYFPLPSVVSERDELPSSVWTRFSELDEAFGWCLMYSGTLDGKADYLDQLRRRYCRLVDKHRNLGPIYVHRGRYLASRSQLQRFFLWLWQFHDALLIGRYDIVGRCVSSSRAASKTFLRMIREVEGGVFYQELGYWVCDLREIFYESSVEVGMSQKASDCFHVCRIFPDVKGDGFTSDSQTQLSFVNVDYSLCCSEEGSSQNDRDQLRLLFQVFPYAKGLLEPWLPSACGSWLLGKGKGRFDDLEVDRKRMIGGLLHPILDFYPPPPIGTFFFQSPIQCVEGVDCVGADYGEGFGREMFMHSTYGAGQGILLSPSTILSFFFTFVVPLWRDIVVLIEPQKGRIIVDVSPKQAYLLDRVILSAFLSFVGSSAVVADKVGIFQPYFAGRKRSWVVMDHPIARLSIGRILLFDSILPLQLESETELSELIKLRAVVLRYVLETDPSTFDGFVGPMFESEDHISKRRGASGSPKPSEFSFGFVKGFC
ncbi:hypothetical protein Tco_0848463 [Tanacetum coccineum]